MFTWLLVLAIGNSPVATSTFPDMKSCYKERDRINKLHDGSTAVCTKLVEDVE